MNTTVGAVEKADRTKKRKQTPTYRCPCCGSHELYVASWVRMNRPVGETLDMIGDVRDSKTGELLPARCTDCDQDIYGTDYLPNEPREGWYRTAKVFGGNE